MPDFVAGSTWSYRAPAGFEASRLIVGAVVRFEGASDLACVAVTGAPRKGAGGAVAAGDIPLIPMTLEALAQTVVAPAPAASLPVAFEAAFEAWHGDARGLTFFTVPYEGSLELMIARQMAALSGD